MGKRQLYRVQREREAEKRATKRGSLRAAFTDGQTMVMAAEAPGPYQSISVVQLIEGMKAAQEAKRPSPRERLAFFAAHFLEYLRPLEERIRQLQHQLQRQADEHARPIPMILHCPLCNARHIDEGEWGMRPHHSHACQECGHVWRPAKVDTVGVWFLPGFKNG